MCEVCGHTPCVPGCPNYYRYSSTGLRCAFCEQPIEDGEEYIQNADGEAVHYLCVDSLRGLLEFLGTDIKTTEGSYE